jgi:2,3-dihydroxybenzoate-AMP ligase
MASAISEHTIPWPEAEAARYVAAGYWAGVPIGTLLRQVANRTPSARALVDPPAGMTLRYAELVAKADACAIRLRGIGLTLGDRIVVQLPNGWEFVVLLLACLRAGIVPVMALPAHRRSELRHLAIQAEASAIAVATRLRDFDHQALGHALAADVRNATGGPWHVLVAGEDLDPASIDLRDLCGPPTDPITDRRILDEAAPNSRDVAVFLLSGGTTGVPKLIARTHDDYAYSALASARIAAVDADAVYLVGLPAGHNFPLACPGILGTLLSGGTVVMLPAPDPAQAFATIAEQGVTHTAAVPAIAGRWLEHATTHGANELRSLRVLQVGGARIADELAGKVAPVLGARLQQVFGMAEGLLNFTRLDDPDDVVCGTQGRPLSPADEIRLVDGQDRDVPDGEPGSLLTRGPYTPRGYYRAAEQNARAFTTDGWYRSGDVCRRTRQGNLIVEGRDKDMINRGGEKISAEEIENLVYQLPGVSEVAAVAMPDRDLGERVCLYLVPRPGAAVTLPEIRALMQRAEVARFKFPERLVIVGELPSTKVGKIDKKALREDIARRLAAEIRAAEVDAGTVT